MCDLNHEMMIKKGHDETELDWHKTFSVFLTSLITSGARKPAENETNSSLSFLEIDVQGCVLPLKCNCLN